MSAYVRGLRDAVRTVEASSSVEEALAGVRALIAPLEVRRSAQPFTTPIEYEGKTWRLADLARSHGLAPLTLKNRLALGWSLDVALRTPLKKRVPLASLPNGKPA